MKIKYELKEEQLLNLYYFLQLEKLYCVSNNENFIYDNEPIETIVRDFVSYGLDSYLDRKIDRLNKLIRFNERSDDYASSDEEEKR